MCMNHTKMGSLLIRCSLKGSSEWSSAVLNKSFKSSFRWMYVDAKQGNMMPDSVCCEYNKTLVLPPMLQLMFFRHLLRPTPKLEEPWDCIKMTGLLMLSCSRYQHCSSHLHIFFRTKLTWQFLEKWLFFLFPYLEIENASNSFHPSKTSSGSFLFQDTLEGFTVNGVKLWWYLWRTFCC